MHCGASVVAVTMANFTALSSCVAWVQEDETGVLVQSVYPLGSCGKLLQVRPTQSIPCVLCVAHGAGSLSNHLVSNDHSSCWPQF